MNREDKEEGIWWSARWPYILIVLLMIGLIVLYVLEFPAIRNTFKPGRLIWGAVIIGAVIGLVVGWFFQRTLFELVDKLRSFAFFIFVFAFFAPLFASWSNRFLSPYAIEERSCELIAKKAFYSERFGFMKGEKPKPAGYYIFVYDGKEIQRIVSRDGRFLSFSEGDTLKLPVKKGLWGIKFFAFQ